jgi:hypothetical protein
MVNKDIRPVYDNRNIYEVDCIARPHGILLESLKTGIYDTYLFYLACAKSYSFIHNLEPYIWPIGVYEFTIKKLGFQYNFHDCVTTNELHECLYRAFKDNTAVIVPANIQKLYYSWSYPDIAALHLFLFTGYNTKTKIYSIIDNLQNLNDSIPKDTDISGHFTDFHMRKEDLDNCFEAMKELDVPLYKNKIVTITKSNSIYIPSTLEKIKYLSVYRDKKYDARCYREVEVFESTLEVFKKMNLPRDGRERFFRFQMVFASKSFLFMQLLQLVREVGTKDDYEKCQNLMKEIMGKWDNYKNIFYLHFMRNSIDTIFELSHVYEPIIKLEENLISILGDIADKAEKHLS